MVIRDVGQAPHRFEQATSKGNCKVTVEVTLAGEPEDPNAVCVIVLEPVAPGPGEENGVVFNVTAEGPPSCQDLEIASEVLLAPKASARPLGGGGRSVPASVNFNPWAYSQVKAKIIGTDCCTVDMFWNEIHLGWWFDGYYAGWGSYWDADGADP